MSFTKAELLAAAEAAARYRPGFGYSWFDLMAVRVGVNDDFAAALLEPRYAKHT